MTAIKSFFKSRSRHIIDEIPFLIMRSGKIKDQHKHKWIHLQDQRHVLHIWLYHHKLWYTSSRVNAIPFPVLWRTVFDKDNRIGYDLISYPHKDFNHQKALGHKQPVTCSTHNSHGIVSEIHCEILHMGSVMGHRSGPPECSPIYNCF